MATEARRNDQAFRAVWRELRKPRILVSYLRKSGDLTVPLIFAGPTFVLVSYVVALGVTPADRASAEFHSAASQIIPVLLLVLAVEGQVFRWEMARSSLSTASREDVGATSASSGSPRATDRSPRRWRRCSTQPSIPPATSPIRS